MGCILSKAALATPAPDPVTATVPDSAGAANSRYGPVYVAAILNVTDVSGGGGRGAGRWGGGGGERGKEGVREGG